MIRVLLIRHGTTDAMRDILCGRMPGVHLNAAGQRQAQDLGRNLASIRNLQAVYSSPLERAQQTAAPIAAAHGLSVETDNAFVEIDCGEWTGCRFDQIRLGDYWSEYNRFRSMSQLPSGESLLDVQARAWPALFAIAKRRGPDSTIALVTHGDVIRALLLFFLGMPVDFIYRLEILPASVTTVSVAPGLAPIVHGVNHTFYLG